jgi:hypothetical protein
MDMNLKKSFLEAWTKYFHRSSVEEIHLDGH